MDHYFDQDLQALEGHPLLEVRRFPYQRLRGPALRMMRAAVATGLQEYARPELETRRRRYARWLSGEVRRLYLERAFDLIVIPSDIFFYVRSLPAAAHALGVPVVVVQKETTISEATMVEHSEQVRAFAPFAADFMTVCSERHRKFWLLSGADPDRIEVTGQPRFDVYAGPKHRGRSLRKEVLFLTYELDAYVPGVGQGMGLRTWEPLRSATEMALLEAARRGACNLVVKCHPQQNHRAECARWRRLAGAAWQRGVRVAEATADTRSLILGVDVVVGFQTTALYEAVAAGIPAVYAAWGAEFERFRTQLIAFADAPPGCVHHAKAPEELAKLLAEEPPAAGSACASWYEEALGPVDGAATGRVAARLQAVAANWPPGEARRTLDGQRRRYAVRLLARSLAVELAWAAATPAAAAVDQHRRANVRRRRAREARRLAIATLRGY